jgi:hypothetical protein
VGDAAWTAQAALSVADPCPHRGGAGTRAAGRTPRRIETPGEQEHRTRPEDATSAAKLDA